MADKSAARTRAETHFSASEQRDAMVKDQLAKESAAFDARTAPAPRNFRLNGAPAVVDRAKDEKR